MQLHLLNRQVASRGRAADDAREALSIMTSTDKKAKARARMAATGENYTTALRAIDEALAVDPVFGLVLTRPVQDEGEVADTPGPLPDFGRRAADALEHHLDHYWKGTPPLEQIMALVDDQAVVIAEAGPLTSSGGRMLEKVAGCYAFHDGRMSRISKDKALLLLARMSTGIGANQFWTVPEDHRNVLAIVDGALAGNPPR